jgi:hypothetical protein
VLWLVPTRPCSSLCMVSTEFDRFRIPSYMQDFHLWAQPWWVNLLLLVPPLSYLYWRRTGLLLNGRKLVTLLLFAISFGVVEAVVVVYLRGTLVTLAPSSGMPSPIQISPFSYQQTVSFLGQIPRNLLTIEVCREAATMIMLLTVSLLAGTGAKERWGAFLWTFAAWDITYYIGLWVTLGWPASLKNYDVLFLIPVPWFAQVWFPMLVSVLAIAGVALSRSGCPS